MFSIRLSPELLSRLNRAAGERRVPVRDYARLCLERGLAEEMIFETQQRMEGSDAAAPEPERRVLGPDLKEEISTEEVLLFIDELLRKRFATEEGGRLVKDAMSRAKSRLGIKKEGEAKA